MEISAWNVLAGRSYVDNHVRFTLVIPIAGSER